MSAGTYQINVGDVFYVGSTFNFKRRRADHQWRLRAGTHQSQKLKQAFESGGTFNFIPLTYAKQIEGQSNESFRKLLRSMEQELIDIHKDNPNLANVSMDARCNDGISKILKEKWKCPEYRDNMTLKRQARRGDLISSKTREKMAQAKRGQNNHKSRPVILNLPNGESQRFDCASNLARHINVSQQNLHQWLHGKFAWPGTIPGKLVKPHLAHIVGMSAQFADEDTEP